ncbi:NACHT domain-containing protein [Bacillus atrophaeus]|uniref:NACHT domain-containing protein n=1 Tax=Bacillus atrophaeus TaxID=1452 RepID=UPI003EC02C4F
MDFGYRLAVPKIKCKEVISSGILVTKNKVITAMHAINPYLLKETQVIEVIFTNEKGDEHTLLARPLFPKKDEWEYFQIIALELEENIEDTSILECADYKFNSPTECCTYGYPAVSETKGTSIDLEIRDELKGFTKFYSSWNLDVKVKGDLIKDYKGCSGGPLLYKDVVVGVMLAQSRENGEASRLNAVSLYIYNDYLKSIEIPIKQKVYNLTYEDYLFSKKEDLHSQLENNLRRNVEEAAINPLGFPIKIQGTENTSVTYDFTQLLEGNDSALILSKPGGGKTYLLGMLMLEIIDSPILSTGKIPIMLKAKDWYREYENVVDGIKGELRYSVPSITEEKILRELKEGNLILFIDGLDEVINNKDLLIKDIKRLNQFRNLKIIITCREQNYHNEFFNLFSEYKLQPLTDEQIIEYATAVFNEEITYPFVYYLKSSLKDLVENPLFLYMTVQIMENVTNKKIPKNKSELYDIFIEYFMQQRLLQNIVVEEIHFDLQVKKDILAEYAYRTFRNVSQPISFREVASNYIPSEDLPLLKKELVKTGVLIEEQSRLDFFHPSIEEYFAALKVSKMSNEEIVNYTQNYHSNEGYIEIFKFVSGLLRNSKCQNVLLDKLEEINLYLYRQCLESRFNFKNTLEEMWTQQYLKDYFKQLRKSYLNIIDNFFKDIKKEFYPWREASTQEFINLIDDEEVTIVGALNTDTLSLSVEFFYGKKEDNVIIRENITPPSFTNQDSEGNVVNIPVRTFNTRNHWYFNLEATDLGLDSSREVAMYVIKNQLKEMIDKQELFEFEAPESLVPSIEYVLKKLPPQYFSINNNGVREPVSLYKHSAETIINVLFFGDNIATFAKLQGEYKTPKSREVFSLIYMLIELTKKQTKFHQYLLPTEDLDRDFSKIDKEKHWVWNFWSKERVVERLSKFFESEQIAYRTLVENCFSNVSEHMSFYSMGPVRFHIGLETDEKTLGGINYIWEPVESITDAKPLIENKEEEHWDYESFVAEEAKLDKALRRLNRKFINGTLRSSSVLMHYIIDDQKLRKDVYKQVLRDLEYVLGKLN